jgi:hypothetical protein
MKPTLSANIAKRLKFAVGCGFPEEILLSYSREC